MISLTQAAALLNLSTRRLRVLCEQGRITGAVKIGSFWAVPAKPKILKL